LNKRHEHRYKIYEVKPAEICVQLQKSQLDKQIAIWSRIYLFFDGINGPQFDQALQMALKEIREPMSEELLIKHLGDYLEEVAREAIKLSKLRHATWAKRRNPYLHPLPKPNWFEEINRPSQYTQSPPTPL
ncbi:MAG: hypothetical protein WCK42_10435, partial [Myxococcaceae bacterium]